MAEHKDVLVYAESTEDKLSQITKELLHIGRKLADDLDESLTALIAGESTGEQPQEAISCGADKVYKTSDPLLKDYTTDAFTTAVNKVAQEVKPRVILMGQTAIGRDLAPRLAFRLNTSAIMDCVSLEIDKDSKRLLGTRPVYGGNALGVFSSEITPQVATVRAKAFPAAGQDTSRKGEVTEIDTGLDASAVSTKVLEKIVKEVEGLKLEDASVVVSGGRGIGSAEGFKTLEELAGLLKGAVGASRPPCDNGWVPEMLQIGITGKIIAPDIYFAIALSGSSQHLSGVSGAKTIVAINKDPEANIFKVADYGIIGDWKKVMPALNNKVQELVS
jgi:electron transfer flavoprotein alpha subunit